MLFNWKDFLEIAQFIKQASLKRTTLSDTFSEEAIHRLGIGRAYYSCFCLSREFAMQNQKFPQTNVDVHKKLITHFQQKNPKLAGYLVKLREWRNNCDYELVLPTDSFQMLSRSIQLAEEALKQIDKMKNNSI